MKQFAAIFLMVITVSIIAPIKSYAADPNEIIWDSSTSSENLPQIINSGEILVVKSGTVINPTIVQTITVNGLVKFESGLSPIKISNINFILDTESDQISYFTNLNLAGSIFIKNGDFELSKSRLQNSTGTAVTIQNSANFLINKNLITDSDTGISISPNSFGTVKNNFFTQNRIAFQIDNNSNVPISANNFKNNSEFAILAANFPAETPLIISQNYFGCTFGPNIPDSTCEKISSSINFTPFSSSPIYQIDQNDIQFTESLADPKHNSTVDEYLYEWFEIYNTFPYPIPTSQIKLTYKERPISLQEESILPFDFSIIASSTLDINIPIEKVINLGKKIATYGLSNDGGQFKLFSLNSDDPMDIFNYGSFSDGIKNLCTGTKEGYSCSRFEDKYEWTSIPTPGAINQKSPIIVIPPVVIPPVIPPTTNPELPATNTCPTAIKINQANNYYNCRVSIIAKVKRSYGSYFYIYDETGELKVYLQSAKKIKKPRLTQNLPIKVTGTLDNYRTGLRLLPDTSSDIELINPPVNQVNTTVNQQSSQQIETPLIQSEPQPAPSLLQAPDSILPTTKAAVKGISAINTEPISTHQPLKIALICGIILLVALMSYNLGLKNGNSKS